MKTKNYMISTSNLELERFKKDNDDCDFIHFNKGVCGNLTFNKIENSEVQNGIKIQGLEKGVKNLSIWEKNIQKSQLLYLVVFLFSLICLTGCNDTKNEEVLEEGNVDVLKEIDTTFPHLEMLDNPEQFKGKKLKGVFIYDGFEGETFSEIGEGLKKFLEKSNDGIYGRFYRFSPSDIGNHRLNMVLFIPKNLNIPNISYGTDDLIIEFICEEGNHYKGNRVLSIERGKKN